ncbi:MAG TPA: kynureninase [Ramlibacter sp.]|uniref:kynureninase n=1 Tax=Ramlibacter sp. TaxID=1917967 RepID=UPI002B773F80|nr:kynureninase [Ramlibacter sp.]HVZ42761.1 kynureninase [Ramlibacter sp.]
MTTLQDCRALDARDPLRPLRDLFVLPPEVIYLDGNSLGPLPRAAQERVARTVTEEWGHGLIRSWNSAGWYEMPRTLGDRIATLIGARAGECVATDSTSVNLFKVLSAACAIAKHERPDAKVILSERTNFPTDLYIAQTFCREHGMRLVLAESDALSERLDDQVAVLMLTHVNYRTGAMHDMRELTRRAHRAGALAIWDLCHSAGAVPIDLHAADADFAIGCGYKYLNGGPGAPAFLWVHPRHADRFEQPLSGWWSHAAPFEFTSGYRPAQGIARYLCGTQPILSMVALECGLDTLRAADRFGGMQALRAKSLALTDLFIALVEQRCAGHGLALVTPRDHAVRGSQVCLAREEGAYAIVQALIARGVIGDFRAPDILRFGFTPLHLGYEDVWNAVEHLCQVLGSGEWRGDEFNRRNAVT